MASRDFAEEITTLRALAGWLEDKRQGEVRAWVQAGQLPSVHATYAVRELVLARFVSPDGCMATTTANEKRWGFMP